jgi:fatty acid desaturase
MAFYALGFTLIGHFQLWGLFVGYWLVPYLVVMPLIERCRSISEHFGLEYTHPLNQARNILGPWWQAFMIGPHHIRLHLDHHMFPAVPQYNLPKLHRLLEQDDEYCQHSHQNDAYFFGKHSVLSDIVSVNAKTRVKAKP